MSDEFNGVTLDNEGNVAAAAPAQLRVALPGRGGERPEPHLSRIHWAFDKTEGIAQGRRIADYVFDHAFRRGDSD